MHHLSVPQVDEGALARLAERIALKVKSGDVIALSGDLGAGKTTFARAFIRALLDDETAEIPSPTFSLVQTYVTPRLAIAHLDLYRIAHEDETRELGIDELLAQGAVLIEWPERAPSLLPGDRLEIRLDEGPASETRAIRFEGFGNWDVRLARIDAISAFLNEQPNWQTATARYLQGDASARAYARLTQPGSQHAHAILMDSPRQPDGPPIRNGLPYSRIAHLAEDVRPFVAIADALRAGGLSVPEIYAADLERGLLLIEDFGDRVFGRELEAGHPQEPLWRVATDALLALRHVPLPPTSPLPGGSTYSLPRQDKGALQIESELLIDWYYPALLGLPLPAEARAEFIALWATIFDRLLALPAGWVLRDYHSPNLMWLPDRRGAARTGIIDFQDALAGPPAYDLVSLLQDARVDVPVAIETRLFDHYCASAGDTDASFDKGAFRFAYAALGAQRSTKILGIFARLANRDGKPAYLRHIPRIWGYLDRDLGHPELAALQSWYDLHLPRELRSRVLET